jgi:hypothetical protein
VYRAKRQRTLVPGQAIGKQFLGGKSLREFSTLRTDMNVCRSAALGASFLLIGVAQYRGGGPMAAPRITARPLYRGMMNNWRSSFQISPGDYPHRAGFNQSRPRSMPLRVHAHGQLPAFPLQAAAPLWKRNSASGV